MTTEHSQLGMVIARPSKGAASAVVLARAANFVRVRRMIGRRCADQLGAAMADRLESMTAPDRVSVIAPDTIEAVLIGANAGDIKLIAGAIIKAFAEPFEIEDRTFNVELEVGAAVSCGMQIDDVRLIEEAEAALADAVRDGTPSIRSLDDSPMALDKAALSRDLLTAMRDSELLLHYQPKVHLRRRTITSVEALLRWQHPTRGLVSPADFIPLAEETGDIAALTLWTLQKVIDDQRKLIATGYNLTVYVNIAGVLLGDEAFVTRASNIVASSGVLIGFEITETSVIRDPQVAIANLNRFSAIGIPIAIDDYGAGLSSLAYLKQLPARELKIDKLFVTQLTSSHRDPLIVRSTIDLAHALEMEVVAEGVETAATAALLSVMGCDMAQGYIISRPISLDALMCFLEDNKDGWNAQTFEPSTLRFAKRV